MGGSREPLVVAIGKTRRPGSPVFGYALQVAGGQQPHGLAKQGEIDDEHPADTINANRFEHFRVRPDARLRIGQSRCCLPGRQRR